MNNVRLEQPHPDLPGSGVIWFKFSGPTWDIFHALLDELQCLLPTLEQPVFLIYDSNVDLPRGNPLPHIRRMISIVKDAPQIIEMVTILPERMVLASRFANVASRVLNFDIDTSMIVQSREEALALCIEISQNQVGD